MSRRLVNITLDNLGDLPPACRSCVFWELDPISKARAEASDPGLEKESWISSVLLEWGSCGKLLYVDGVPAAYVLFAPPQYVPRSVAFPTSPVSADAVLLMTARVLSEFSGGGLGRMLIQGMAKDLTRRGVRAIEAFGDKQWTAPACVLPVDYLLAVGFKTVRPHHRHPRLRMELRSTLSWREDVEVALERLLGSMTPERVLRPAPAPAVVSGLAKLLGSDYDAAAKLGKGHGIALDRHRARVARGLAVPGPAKHIRWGAGDRDIRNRLISELLRGSAPDGEVSLGDSDEPGHTRTVGGGRRLNLERTPGRAGQGLGEVIAPGIDGVGDEDPEDLVDPVQGQVVGDGGNWRL